MTMETKKRFEIVAILAAAILVWVIAGALVMAQSPGPYRGSGPSAGPGFGYRQPPVEQAFGLEGASGQWWNNQKLIDQLKLTADQRKAMDAILQDHRKRLIDLRASLQKAELDMQPLMGADQPNENQILAQIDKVAQARAELEKANARFLLALRSKLTADQWKQMQEIDKNKPNPSAAPRTWTPGQQGGRGTQKPGTQQRPDAQPPAGNGPPSAPPPPHGSGIEQ